MGKTKSPMKHTHLLMVVILGFLLSTSRGLAQLIAYDGFSYTTGAGGLYGSNGGTGWASAWTGFPTSSSFNTVNSGSMSYTDAQSTSLTTTGNSVEIVSGSTTAPSYTRALSSALTPSTGSSVWLSFLGAGTGGSTMGLTLFNGSTQLLQLGNSGTNNAWGIRQLSGGSAFSSSGVAMSSSVGTLGSTYLVVVKISFQDGADKVEMFLNPTLGTTDPTSSTSLGYASQQLVDITSLSQIGFGVGTASQKLDFDELRIGTTYADVVAVPEPKALALIGVSSGMLYLLNITQRRRKLSSQG